MIIKDILLLIFCVVVMVVGQILFKQVAINYNKSLTLLSTQVVGLGTIAVGLYFISTVLWIVVLRNADISKAYPFFALGFVLIPIAGYVLFEESLGYLQIFGILLITIGVVLSGIGK